MIPKIGLLMRAKIKGHIHDCYFINQDYVKALTEANAQVVLIYPQAYASLKEVLTELNGIVIPGGMDVDPYFYNQDNTDSTTEPIEVDRLDLDAIEIAQMLNLPILGICRGLQIINVALGGSLIQNIDHHSLSTDLNQLKGHKILIEKGNILHELFGGETEVNSYHHQAIDKLATTLNVIAQSEDDTIEAIEGKNILAVQWHPERMRSNPEVASLFKAFVESCK